MYIKIVLACMGLCVPTLAAADGCITVNGESTTVIIVAPSDEGSSDIARLAIDLVAMTQGGRVLSYVDACEDLPSATSERAESDDEMVLNI